MRKIVICILTVMASLSATAQSIQMTTAEAKSLYKNVTMHHVSVHDPSIVFDKTTGYYYVIGSHRGLARSRDLQNWTELTEKFGVVRDNGTIETITFNANNKKDIERAFRTNQTKQITKGGQIVTFGNYDAAAWACALPDGDGNEWGLDGVMWAPDIVWNPHMQKWCQYMGINGYNGNSVIVLLTADKIEGPWIYEGPVTYSGFRTTTDARVSWKLTDLELVIGEQNTLPDRYNKPTNGNGVNWGDWWPNNIDPCAFFDEDGELWLAYGSWSGGIWMLKLNKENGLRDYDVTYATDYSPSTKAMTSDAYFGKRIAGGCYVSGEGPYIQHIGQYYYLFVSYGGFAPDGGYQMRVFRSEKPDGPYVDCRNQPATYTSWQVNYGPNTSNRGQLLMSSYNLWGFQTVGECAQGHNSAITDDNGRSYVVYHTKFNDGTYGHLVRVHQLFQNERGWLVAAPFEYNGEEQTDAQNATQQLFQPSEVPGTWQLLLHQYGLNHEKMEEVTPVEATFAADGTISGGVTGRWNIVEGTVYIHVIIGATTYYGVLTEQQLEPTSIKALCFTSLNTLGAPLWGYKVRENYQLARQVNTQTVPVSNAKRISANVDLYGIPLLTDIALEWTSSEPDIFSDAGLYNPAGTEQNTAVQLTVKETCGDYFWTQSYNVTALKDSIPGDDYKSGMLAYYNFDQQPATNILNPEETATLRRTGSTSRPTFENHRMRNGQVLHQYCGESDTRYSYAEMPNPYYLNSPLGPKGRFHQAKRLKELSTLNSQDAQDGMTIAFWVQPNDDNLKNTILAFYDIAQRTRFYMTPNAYFNYSNGTDNIDINYPTRTTGYITPGQWNHVVVTISPSTGITVYVNATAKANTTYTYKGNVGGSEITRKAQVPFQDILSFIRNCPKFYLGYGGNNTSADMLIDDLFLYNRCLTQKEIRALYFLANRVYSFAEDITSGISSPLAPGSAGESCKATDGQLYDLTGRKVNSSAPQRGVYIRNHKKIVVNP